MVEGATEKVFKPHLLEFLRPRFKGPMPRLVFRTYDGRIPKGEKLRQVVRHSLSGKNAADGVIALTDVYTGGATRDFTGAADAKAKMTAWVGKEETRFYPHVALHDFEAWLLPYWPTIQRLAGHNTAAPAGNPEAVNHEKPPAYRIKEIFETGRCRDSYVKPRDAGRILKGNDLLTAVNACAELKALVNSILSICGGQKIS